MRGKRGLNLTFNGLCDIVQQDFVHLGWWEVVRHPRMCSCEWGIDVE